MLLLLLLFLLLKCANAHFKIFVFSCCCWFNLNLNRLRWDKRKNREVIRRRTLKDELDHLIQSRSKFFLVFRHNLEEKNDNNNREKRLKEHVAKLIWIIYLLSYDLPRGSQKKLFQQTFVLYFFWYYWNTHISHLCVQTIKTSHSISSNFD